MLALRRLWWAVDTLPADPELRDRKLIERAAYALDHGGSPELARHILAGHSLPRHAVRALLRERDLIENAREVNANG